MCLLVRWIFSDYGGSAVRYGEIATRSLEILVSLATNDLLDIKQNQKEERD